MIEAQQILALLTSGTSVNPGDSPGARPVPQQSLRQWAEDSGSALLDPNRYPAIEWDALYFTFYAEPATTSEPEAIVVSKRDVWCLLRRGNTVLLSDGVTHHTTRIYAIDRENDAIVIVDPWPDRFFMLRGRNVRGYTAELLPMTSPGGRKTLIRVSRNDFLKTVVGFVAMDTTGLIGYYSSVDAVAARKPKTLLSFGLTLLHWGDNRFVDRSLPLIRSTLHLARQGKDVDTERVAANRLHLANLLSHFTAVERNDRARADAALADVKRLERRYGRHKLISSNRAPDNYRIALAARSAGDFDSAIAFFSWAIDKDANYEVAYLDRAVVWAHMGESTHVIADTTKAITLNAHEVDSLTRERASRHPPDPLSQSQDAERERRLLQWRIQALGLRASHYYLTGLFREALVDAQVLVSLQPNSATGHAMIGLVEFQSGRLAAAKEALQRAVELEKDPRLLEMATEILREVEARLRTD